MKYEIYQLNTDLESGVEMLYMGYDWNTSHGHEITADKYNKVYEGEINDPSNKVTSKAIYAAESLYTMFNLDCPANFTGHSMSVSDVIVLDGKAYYCDRIGFTKLPDFFKAVQ